MGIKERKERYKEEFKVTILEAAKQLFLEKGFEATSMRNIAEKIEFSPTTLYLYYKDKSDLVYALHQEGFLLLNAQFKLITFIESPFERLRTMGRLYMQFAMENPAYYQLMFIMKEPLQFIDNHKDNEEWKEGENAYYSLFNTIVHCQETGYFKDMEPHSCAMVVWATLHGLCTMKIHGHLEHLCHNKELLPDVETLLENCFQTFMKMLEKMK